MRINALVAGAAAVMAVAAPASAAQKPLAEDARAFGVRENIQSIEISPSGNKLLMVTAGKGRASLLQTIDLATKSMKAVAAASGDPEKLYWCAFGSDTQLV